MTAAEFRGLALSLPEVTESSPLGVPEFCVRSRSFAGLSYPVGERAAVKLTPETQAQYMAAEPDVFFLAKGPRGLRGWTIVQLAPAKQETLQAAIVAAWRGAAPKKLRQQYESD